jgi:REP element-mobilizing transposase RayT
MPQSLAKVYIHLVFSTKNREPLIPDSLRERLQEYMAGILRDLGAPALEIHVEPDHAHVLFLMSRTVTLSDAVMQLKRGSSIWLKEIDPPIRNFHWQAGYGAFSVSQSKLEIVRRYVRNQREHHRSESFQDEFRRWLREYGIEFDERYVWD